MREVSRSLKKMFEVMCSEIALDNSDLDCEKLFNLNPPKMIHVLLPTQTQ